MTEEEEIKQRFKLVCLKCGSEDVRIDVSSGVAFSEMSQDPASVSIGCNACKQNDYLLYV